jgi:hypothetical protein
MFHAGQLSLQPASGGIISKTMKRYFDKLEKTCSFFDPKALFYSSIENLVLRAIPL